MSKWTDREAREKYGDVVALAGQLYGDFETEAVGRRLLDLEAELAEQSALSDRLADILKRTANALKGEPEPLSSHSWHDLPERAGLIVENERRLIAELAAMRPVVERACRMVKEYCDTRDALPRFVPGLEGSAWEHMRDDYYESRERLCDAVDAYRAQQEGK